ncbi:hypothetical protein LO80_06740 [Candidatus Francisella endociliophora]|uniref:Peptide transporter n=1 Tax=Candidatus Francisella endociliophora TaxID=653937 RepID=A0A097EQ47_9GAMM|nr:oligopeptide:H+ symporter [Francisella sp. FSC1006]AIT09690.1 hypothetical protein LO80_06740 [Francisella sp. FSC1006]
MKIYRYIIALEVVEYFAYAMLATILLYSILHKGLGLAMPQAVLHMSAFISLLYCFIALGGFIGDRVLGSQNTLLLGMFLICLGYIGMVFFGYVVAEHLNLYYLISIPLALICIGTGAFKSNSSKIFAELIEEKKFLDTKFVYFLISINIGAALGGLISPAISKYIDWQFVMLAAFFITLVSWILILKALHFQGSKILNLDFEFKRVVQVLLGVFAIVLLGAFVISNPKLVLVFQTLVIIFILIFLVVKAAIDKENYSQIAFALVVLLLAWSMIFVFTQRTISVNTFTILCTDHKLFGFIIPPESFQALEPLWVVVVGPLCILFMRKNSLANLGIKYLNNITIGIFACGLGYLLLYCATLSRSSEVVSSDWILVFQLFMAFAELIAASTALSIICSYMPVSLRTTAIGLWFILISYAHLISGYVVKNSLGSSTDSTKSLIPEYSNIFKYCVLIMIISFVVGRIIRVSIKVKPQME